MVMSFCAVLDEILNLIESVSEGFPPYSENTQIDSNWTYKCDRVRFTDFPNRLYERLPGPFSCDSSRKLAYRRILQCMSSRY